MKDISFEQFRCGDQCSLTQMGLKNMPSAPPAVIGLPLSAILTFDTLRDKFCEIGPKGFVKNKSCSEMEQGTKQRGPFSVPNSNTCHNKYFNLTLLRLGYFGLILDWGGVKSPPLVFRFWDFTWPCKLCCRLTV